MKQTLIKIDKWINDKLTPIEWYNKILIIICAGIAVRLIVLLLR